jgi:chloride channel protein, CIC family
VIIGLLFYERADFLIVSGVSVGVIRKTGGKGIKYYICKLMQQAKTIVKLLIWRAKHLSEKHLILILAIVVGLLGGLAALLFKTLVHFMEVLVRDGLQFPGKSYLYFAFPLLGIFLTVLFVKYFVKDRISHGISRILFAISKRKSDIKPHNMYSSIVASTVTSSMGGSVGLEAPIVYTGSAIGSNLGRLFRMNYKTKTLLIGCGAAAAIAGIFKAPIAGVLFTLEILMIDLTMASLLPLLVASICGAIISYLFLGNDVVFYFSISDPFNFKYLHFYILLGIVAGLISLYFTRVLIFIERRFSVVRSDYKKIIFGGIGLGMLVFIFPPLYGEGYLAMKSLLSGHPDELLSNSLFTAFTTDQWAVVFFLILVLIYKVVATAFTTGAGGVGGIFAPALFMGGLTGYLFSHIINLLSSTPFLSERNFTLVGMAGLMSGIMHAPLTGIFLIAEITGGYELFLPLMITAIIAFLTIRIFEPHSIYTRNLARQGALITHNKDKAVLTLLNLDTVIERNLSTVRHDASLGDLIEVVKRSSRNIFPVLNDEGILLGIVTLDDIREIMFDKELYRKTWVVDYMVQSPENIQLTDSMDSVMEKFNRTGYFNLPVIDGGKYIGFVSRANLFNEYRRLLMEFSDD